MRGTAHGRHTDLGCAPLSGTRPRDLCLKDRTLRSVSLLVLPVVESFPGAVSPLRSTEPHERFSYHIRPLVHQDRGDPRAELTRHRHNGDPRSQMARMSPAHRAVKFPQLAVLSNGRPRGLDEFPSQPAIARVGDRASIGCAPVDRSVGTSPRNAASWRTLFISRQSPILASS